jgi:hypothetical protein
MRSFVIRDITTQHWGCPAPYLHHLSILGKVKVKLSLCLTKYHAMKTYWGVEV